MRVKEDESTYSEAWLTAGSSSWRARCGYINLFGCCYLVLGQRQIAGGEGEGLDVFLTR